MRTCRVALAALLLLLTGCTAVPGSSAPQTVGPVNLDQDGNSPSAPPRNASARYIVTSFLDANGSDPSDHASARTYLTRQANAGWSDQRVTIISGEQIPTGDAATGRLDVTGRVVGTITAAGVYQPSLQGTGDGGAPTSFPFTIKQVDGQNRIDSLHNGLLLTTAQFQQYSQHPIYFYDLADRTLVADVRWTNITDPAALATWLVGQLATGPRPELQDAVSTDTFPAQANQKNTVARGNSDALSIEIPGAAQLDRTVQDRLAQQVMRTLEPIAPVGRVTITDGGTPVVIPDLGSSSFSAASFPDVRGTADQKPDEVHYLQTGLIKDADGRPLAGPLGNGTYYLLSFALARRPAGGPLLVAGVSGTDTRTLYLGSQYQRLRQTSVSGDLTRPTWAPGRSEVWIGVGSSVHRLVVSGTTYQDSRVQLPPTVGAGRIRSVRLSPDGQQIALVVSGSSAAGGVLYIGAIARDNGAVRVTGLAQVSPSGVRVVDADWNTTTRLTAVGSYSSTGAPSVFDLGADGALWRSLGLEGLPDQPQNVTASQGTAWVEAQGQVWVQSGGGDFTSPNISGQQPGLVPDYLT